VAVVTDIVSLKALKFFSGFATIRLSISKNYCISAGQLLPVADSLLSRGEGVDGVQAKNLDLTVRETELLLR